MLFWGDYYLMIEERACRKTDLGGGDYYLRNSGLPPSSDKLQNFARLTIVNLKELSPTAKH